MPYANLAERGGSIIVARVYYSAVLIKKVLKPRTQVVVSLGSNRVSDDDRVVNLLIECFGATSHAN
jgi:hypothetical protein